MSATSCCDCKSEQAARQAPVDDANEGSNDEGLSVISQEDPWTYEGPRLRALEFPLGGFGTGQILLQGDGTLQGWTITNNFHNPEYTQLNRLPGNLFGIKATMRGDDPHSHCYVLQTRQSHTNNPARANMSDDAHAIPNPPFIPSLTAKCQYPIATLNYKIPSELPLEIQLESMSPLIPGNTKDSSIPLAIFTFTVHNTSEEHVADVCLLQSTLNLIGWDGKSSVDDQSIQDFWEANINTPLYHTSCRQGHGYAGWAMTSQNSLLPPWQQGSLALVAVQPTTSSGSGGSTASCCGTTGSSDWKPGLLVANHQSEQDFWQDFCQGKVLDPKTYTTPTEPSVRGITYIGGVTQSFTLPPKATKTCQFILTWYFPNRPSYSDRPHLPSPILGNYYQNWYDSAEDVVQKSLSRMDYLVSTTRTYVDILYSTTIPWELLESAAGRVSVMRSPSMFWTREGLVLGNEGNDCCPLNCTHVYGYSMMMERLFPDWAKNMLHSNFVLNFDPDQGCSMRFGQGGFAIDGSLACIIKVYLVVKQADSKLEFLAQVWPNVKRQIQIILDNFVKDDKDCVIRCLQQNTYDTAMQGANTFIGTYWITALRATAKMAKLMGEDDLAQVCQHNSELAAKAYEEICWKEDFQYYIADVDETNCTNSYGTGCFVDQLSAVGLSLAAGLGTVLNPDHEALARQSIYRYNQVAKPPFQDFQKHFYNGDKGVRVNTYPHGKLPGCYVYDDLVSTGFSYPVIAAMIQDEANTDIALEWARHIRNRHSGVNRSPWNEPECGLLYVRAMAAWNLLDQACGFDYNSTTGALSFAPKFHFEDFSCFLIVEDGWGRFHQKWETGIGKLVIECHYGVIRLNSLATSQVTESGTLEIVARLDQTMLASSTLSLKINAIYFGEKLTIAAGSTLVIKLEAQEPPSYPCDKPTTTKSTFQRIQYDRRIRLALFLFGLIYLSLWWLGWWKLPSFACHGKVTPGSFCLVIQ